MTQAPLISVIIVNWNGREILRECLKTVFAELEAMAPPGMALEVIVSDNGSTDGSVEMVKKDFPSVLLIENKENLGFAAGNNRAIVKAAGKYILTLNNDTELKAGFFSALVTSIEGSESTVGMWAPKILSITERDVIDSVGGLLVYGDGLARGRGRLERDTGVLDSDIEVFIPSACAALYSADMLLEVGLFDEDFFAYCEDTDLGLRARLAGFTTRSVPEAVVYHHYSATTGKYSPFKAYLVERNRAYVAIKNFPLLMLLLSPFYTFWRYVVQGLGLLSGRGAGARFKEGSGSAGLIGVLLKAYASIIVKLPRMLCKRRRVMRLKRVTDLKFAKDFSRFSISARELTLKD